MDFETAILACPPLIDMALVELGAVELRRQIGEKKVSPVELMQACIDHIETYNPAVNAICATDYERVLVSARAAEAQVSVRSRMNFACEVARWAIQSMSLRPGPFSIPLAIAFSARS